MKKKPLDLVAIFPQINDIHDESLRIAVTEVWDELWRRSSWLDINAMPTSVEVPSYPHIPHNQAVLTMALAVADTFESIHGVKVNRDHLIAGAVLQDASKVVETEPDPEAGIAQTETGKSLPHAFWAAHVALQKGVPESIVHIILNHTPQSPRFPESLEGKILYYVDQLDMVAIYKDRWRKELMITK